MPLPDSTPPIVSAPPWAGVGLRAELLAGMVRFPMPDWPADWWMRNYDLLYEYEAPGVFPVTERMLRVPGFPYPEEHLSTDPGRPTVDQVALLLRARTKDSAGNEVGTFDEDTRPTGDQVDEQIDVAMGLVGVRFPTTSKLTPEQVVAFGGLVAYRAALRIEKSYFPEQVRSDRSAYAQLREEYLDDLQALVESVSGSGGGEFPDSDMAMVPVGSWTSLPYSFLWYADDPDLVVEGDRL